ncbi:hypothetical protein SAMN05192588_0950 [Nonlabens sp. Hel1_33_55]|uniref:hypothetical protein n=1 Tax=Nonlabens sp. Hel1_33_55 TaxID=1336802 RepID=UPI000875B8A9|nr:hypothetical protein [Nonlabens sp. Hel1_33_55]SCY06266.1 hypothetical protein SAMN05192588_0950 [Nonlabens sp. Hel1_33_55]
MKTIKNLIAATLLFTALNSYATEIEIVSSANVTTLQFSNVKKGQQVTIKDDFNTILYKETIQANGTYAKKFNLTALEDGSYTIELTKDYEIIVKSFDIKAKQVKLNQSNEVMIFKPNVRLEDVKMIISQLSLTKSPLNVELYYNGVLIHNDKITGDTILSRVYQLSATKKGNYRVVMNSNDHSFTKNFTI